MSRPSPALVVAVIALFVALGGTGYAAVKLNGKNIVNRSIGAKKIKRDALGGREVNEAKLGTVPSAVRSDSANSAVSARIADDAHKLGNKAASAYLLTTGTAMNSDMLDGMDSADFLKARGVGPVILDMPGTAGGLNSVELIAGGPLTIVGECENAGGVPRARVGLQHSVEAMLFTGDSAGTTGVFPVSFPPTTRTIAETNPGSVLNFQRRDFSAISNPVQATRALQGSATAISDAQSNRCYLSAWGFSS